MAASTTHRRRLRRSDPASTRDLILEEAMRVVGRHGVEGLKVKDLADAVGVRTPSVYKHFINRDAIIAALARRMVDELGRFLQPDEALEPRAWMEAWSRALVLFFATRRAFVLLILREIATPGGVEAMEIALGPPETALQDPALRPAAEMFGRKLAEGLEAGVFRATNAQRLAALLWGAVLVALAWPYGAPRTVELTSAELADLQDAVVRMFAALAHADPLA